MMTRSARPLPVAVGSVALLAILGCPPAPDTGPSPKPASSAPATPSPTVCSLARAKEGRWATIVLFRTPEGCGRIAGPARIGACPGETITWRVYNRCGQEKSVRVDDFVYSQTDPGIPSPAEEEYNSAATAKRPAAPVPGADRSNDAFAGKRSIRVGANRTEELKLTVSATAPRGYYKYFTYLSDQPDADQQIEIWP